VIFLLFFIFFRLKIIHKVLTIKNEDCMELISFNNMHGKYRVSHPSNAKKLKPRNPMGLNKNLLACTKSEAAYFIMILFVFIFYLFLYFKSIFKKI
jgi:hypothetical protein